MLGSLVKQKHRGEFSIFGIPSKMHQICTAMISMKSPLIKNSWGKIRLKLNASNNIKVEMITQIYRKSNDSNGNKLVLKKKPLKTSSTYLLLVGIWSIMNYEMGMMFLSFQPMNYMRTTSITIFAEGLIR